LPRSKKSIADNQQRLRKYEWVETTIVSMLLPGMSSFPVKDVARAGR
jgi:hypothetical protein